VKLTHLIFILEFGANPGISRVSPTLIEICSSVRRREADLEMKGTMVLPGPPSGSGLDTAAAGTSVSNSTRVFLISPPASLRRGHSVLRYGMYDRAPAR